MTKFNPNQVTFSEGALRVERAVRLAKFDAKSRIVTSRDESAKMMRKLLPVQNVPKGFSKWQLPFVLDQTQLFMTVAEAGAVAEEHSHDDGDGIRFVVSGSIHYGDKELKAGDWMFIPKGVKYSFRTGPNGAAMCYCYCCCCAGLQDIRDWISDPPFEIPAHLR